MRKMGLSQNGLDILWCLSFGDKLLRSPKQQIMIMDSNTEVIRGALEHIVVVHIRLASKDESVDKFDRTTALAIVSEWSDKVGHAIDAAMTNSASSYA